MTDNHVTLALLVPIVERRATKTINRFQQPWEGCVRADKEKERKGKNTDVRMGIAISTEQRERGTKKDKNTYESRYRTNTGTGTGTGTCECGKLSNGIIDRKRQRLGYGGRVVCCFLVMWMSSRWQAA